MNISTHQLKRQFDQVYAAGWWTHLEEAARAFFDRDPVDASILFAIGSRETNWNPRWLREPGDRGNGFGFFQIDRRSFPGWVARDLWHDPRECIMKGAEVLRAKIDDTRAFEGRPITMTWRGNQYTVQGKRLSPEERVRVAIAAYNSGRWAHYHASKGRSPDHGTTGKDYSADVLERAAAARQWAPQVAGKTCPTCEGKGMVPV